MRISRHSSSFSRLLFRFYLFILFFSVFFNTSCARVGFSSLEDTENPESSPLQPPSDAGSLFDLQPFSSIELPADGAVSSSDANPAAACQQWSGFGPVQYDTLQLVNTTGDEWSPTLTDNQLSLFFHDGASAQLWTTTRSSATAAFNSPTILSELNSSFRDKWPSVSGDGRLLAFVSYRPGGAGDGDIWLAERSDVSIPFSPPQNLERINTGTIDGIPVLSTDGNTLFFYRYLTQELNNVYVTSRSSRSERFPPAIPVPELNTNSHDRVTAISSDLLEVFVQSDRPGGTGGYDIWRATRQSTGHPFGQPTPVAELNTSTDDMACSLSPDGTTLYVNVGSPILGGGSQSADIGYAKRICLD